MSDFTLWDAVELAKFAHRNQYDKAGEPYITHPLRVLESVKAQGAQAHVQMAAVTHDVTEDTPFTPQMLLELGMPEAAVDIVRLLDRGLSEKVYIECLHIKRLKDKGGIAGEASDDELAAKLYTKGEFYYRSIRRNHGALQVKLADIEDNLQPWRLNYLPEHTQARLRAKYAEALRILS